MGRTHKTVSNPPAAKAWTPATAAAAVGQALHGLEGRWKLLILFQLFGGQVQRFSALERAIPGVTQKMLAQQLRQLERVTASCTARCIRKSRRGWSMP
jgi:DNA-binding HxlR family transcriptional regulator